MPDTDFVDVTTSPEGAEKELARDDSTGEIPGLPRTHSDHDGDTDADGWTTVRRVDTYSQLTYEGQGDGAAVIHICNRCDDQHTDTFDPAVPFPTSRPHAPENKWGFRSGQKFSSVKVTGTVWRRTEIWKRRGNDNFQTNDVPRWEKRTIDHIEQRPYIAWTELLIIDCTHGVREQSISMLEGPDWLATELFATIADSGFLTDKMAFMDEDELLMKAANLALELEAPSFRPVLDGRTLVVSLMDGDTNRGKLEIEIEDNATGLKTKSWLIS